MKSIGIEKINVYPGSLSLDLLMLANHRNTNLDYIQSNMMVNTRSLLPLWEDTVTLTVNAANFLTEDEKQTIGLFIVATESGLDQEKAISTWAHKYIGLPSSCRVFELKIACHAGAAALKMAESWLRSGLANGKKALIVAADSSYSGLNKNMAEYSLGAGAVALLVSDKADFALIEEGKSGIYTSNITDVIRPLPWKEIAYDVEGSLLAYMDGLEYSYQNYIKNLGEITQEYFDYNIYHIPFPGISYLAHKLFMELHEIFDKDQITESFKKKVSASLTYSKNIGATYTGSIFLALLSLICHSTDIDVGKRVGIYSYGSGSCAEYFSMIIGSKAKFIANNIRNYLDTLLENRYQLNITEYEMLEESRETIIRQENFEPRLDSLNLFYEKFYHKNNLLILKSIIGHKRNYEFV